VGAWMQPDESWLLHAFLGAMLCATSVGITARVLGDLGLVKTREARIILGAAVIDDVMGLAVLAVISGIITAANTGTPVGLAQIALILAKAVLFLVGALWIGSIVSPRLFRTTYALRSRGLVQALALGFCFVLSDLALRAGLAPIVGAFAAGLVLEDVHVEEHVRSGDWPLAQSLTPLIGLFVPIFFVRMGLLVDLRAVLGWKVLGFAAVLTLAAAVGKLVCGAVVPRGVSRALVGLGMMPRGEVGLIFAGVGAQLRLGGHPVVDPATYAAAVAMVVATTLATPPLLTWAARRTGMAPTQQSIDTSS
jgi:Na+:H+ antiporter